MIYGIINSNKYLLYKQDSEIMRIPYNDILFIEKDKRKELEEICLLEINGEDLYEY